ncbi:MULTISPECIES: hypothetical protein [Pseudomonas]|nr:MULTISPECIES: hypothetical protein [Pseudomonas]
MTDSHLQTFKPGQTVLVKDHSRSIHDDQYRAAKAMVGNVCVVIEDLGESGVLVYLKDKAGAVSFARTEVAPCPRLTKTQWKVMRWLSQGWAARVSHGSVVVINGAKVCNADTMGALERFGLVASETAPGYWEATAAGKQLKPPYGWYEG